MAQHVGISRSAIDFVGGSGREVVQYDGPARALAQLYVTVNVLAGQRILEAAGDLVFGQFVEQTRHVVFGAVHGEIVVQLEPLGCHLLHGLGLIDHVFERGQVELHPRVALLGVGQHGSGHAVGMRAHRPRRDRYPGAILLAKELVHGNAGGFAHEVVHRRPQTEGGLVA